MSCGSCHNPLFGWSDGLPTARGSKSAVLERASPTIVNTAYNSLQMWDGRKKTLEEQAMGPMEASVEMNMDTQKLFRWLNGHDGYRGLFSRRIPASRSTRIRWPRRSRASSAPWSVAPRRSTSGWRASGMR